MYPLLRLNDRLPTVAALQILLNRLRSEPLTVDGDFGLKTKAALEDFQEDIRWFPKGEVDAETWTALTRGTNLQVVDSVDCTDPHKLERQEYTSKVGTVKHLPSTVDLRW